MYALLTAFVAHILGPYGCLNLTNVCFLEIEHAEA